MSADDVPAAGTAAASASEENVVTATPVTTTTAAADTTPKDASINRAAAAAVDAKHIQLPESGTSRVSSNTPVCDQTIPNAGGAKRIIRKYMVIDPKKLQQAGLDRKLAEAIGRQKLAAQNKEASVAEGDNKKRVEFIKTSSSSTASADSKKAVPNEDIKLATTSAATATVTTTAMAITKTRPSLKLATASLDKSVKFKKTLITPKITITRPGDSPAECISKELSPENRLANVKSILQRKILDKQARLLASQSPSSSSSTSTSSSPLRVEIPRLLTPKLEIMSPPIDSDNTPCRLTSPFAVHSNSSVDSIESKSPKLKLAVKIPPSSSIKTPLDVARMLSYSIADGTLNTLATVKQEPTGSLPKTVTSKPKTIIIRKIGKVSKQSVKAKVVECARTSSLEHFINKGVEKSGPIPKIMEFLNDIPKASVKTSNQIESLTSTTPNEMLKLTSKKIADPIAFPDMSPLKQPFPTVTHAQSLPLPTISTFKRTFPTSISGLNTDVQHVRPAIELPNSQSHSEFECDDNKPSLSTNSLIVLENKVLSHDEKIDLTALGLATPKLEPYKPDTTLVPFSMSSFVEQTESTVKTEAPSMMVASVTQSRANATKRTIIPTDKLKLSADKIAALAKAIKSNQISTSPAKTVQDAPVEIKKESDSEEKFNRKFLMDPTGTFGYFEVENSSSDNSNNIESEQMTSDFDCRPSTESELEFKDPLPPMQSTVRKKSLADVTDSGDDSDCVISAVDFIASLTATNPITEDTKLELSADELNLNASFSMGFSPLRIPYSTERDITARECSASEPRDISDGSTTLNEMFNNANDDVQIGKIVTISEENILKTVSEEHINELLTIEKEEILETMYEEMDSAAVPQVDEFENMNIMHIQPEEAVNKAESEVVVRNEPIMDLTDTISLSEFRVKHTSATEKSKNPLEIIQADQDLSTIAKDNSLITEESNSSSDRLALDPGHTATILSSIEPNSTVKSVVERPNSSASDSSSTAPKRFKKGKINLVQRKKIAATSRSDAKETTIPSATDKNDGCVEEADNAKSKKNDKSTETIKLPQSKTDEDTWNVASTISDRKTADINQLLYPPKSIKRKSEIPKLEDANTSANSNELCASASVTNLYALVQSQKDNVEDMSTVATIPFKKKKVDPIILNEATVGIKNLITKINEGKVAAVGNKNTNEENLNVVSVSMKTATPVAVEERSDADFSSTDVKKSLSNALQTDKQIIPDVEHKTAQENDAHILSPEKIQEKINNNVELQPSRLYLGTCNVVELSSKDVIHKSDEMQETEITSNLETEKSLLNDDDEVPVKSSSTASDVEFKADGKQLGELVPKSPSIVTTIDCDTPIKKENSKINLDSETLGNTSKKASATADIMLFSAQSNSVTSPETCDNIKTKNRAFFGFDEVLPTSTSKTENNLETLLTAANTENVTRRTSHKEGNTDPIEPTDSATKTTAHTKNISVLKSWLTTGKTISPTRMTRLSFDKIKASTSNSVPPKKRWEWERKSQDDIEVTDDTSPADDDDDDDDNNNDVGGDCYDMADNRISFNLKKEIEKEPIPYNMENEVTITMKKKTDFLEQNVGTENTEKKSTNPNISESIPTAEPTTVSFGRKGKRASRASKINSVDVLSDCVNEVDSKTIVAIDKRRDEYEQKTSESFQDVAEKFAKKCANIEEVVNSKQNSEEMVQRSTEETIREETSIQRDNDSNVVKPKKQNNRIAENKLLASIKGRKSSYDDSSSAGFISPYLTQTRGSTHRLSLDISNCQKNRDNLTAVRERKSIIEFSESHERKKTGSESDAKVHETEECVGIEDKSATTECSTQANKQLTKGKGKRKSVPKSKASKLKERIEPLSESKKDTDDDDTLNLLGAQQNTKIKSGSSTENVVDKPEETVNKSDATADVTPVSSKKKSGRKSKLKLKVDTTMNADQISTPVTEKKTSLRKSKTGVENVASASTPEAPPTNMKRSYKKSKRLTPVTNACAVETASTQSDDDTPIQKKKPERKSAANANSNIVKTDNTKNLPRSSSKIKVEAAEDMNMAGELLIPMITRENVNAVEEKPTPRPKRRTRAPKDVVETPVSSSDSAAKETPLKEKKRPGRKANAENSVPLNSRLLLIKQRSQLETDEVLTVKNALKPSKDAVQCGLCLDHLERDKWTQHLSTHYGVGWIVNEMPPIDINARSVVLNVMTIYMKSTAGKYTLGCRMCQRQFRSALGVLLHIEQCGATATRVTCQYCSREYSKLSLTIHERTCAVRIDDNDEQEAHAKAAVEDNNAEDEVFNNLGRVKRVSVMKAEKRLKAIGDELLGTSASGAQEAKNHVKFVPATVAAIADIEANWTNDLEQKGGASCPAGKCSYESNVLKDLQDHFNDCKHKAKGVYLCTLCETEDKPFVNMSDAVKHVQNKHLNLKSQADFEGDSSDCGIKTDDEPSEDEDDGSSGVNSDENDMDVSNENSASDSTSPRKHRKKPQQPKTTPSSRVNNVFPPRFRNITEETAEMWNEFISTNHTQEPLYTFAAPSFTLQSTADFAKYLPGETVSMKYCFSEKTKFIDTFGAAEQMTWSEMQRFDSISTKYECCTFVGAPIKKLAWAPLPADAAEQYLLVSYRREYTRNMNPKISNAILLLYKVTPAEDSTTSPLELHLHYGINIPEGPVHCMAFLPSGGYDPKANRLGLIAIGNASSKIKIYALPLVVKQEERDAAATQLDNQLPLIELKVAMVLTLTFADDLKDHTFVDTQCVELCWSEATPHLHIFAGYENGCACWWDIDESMNFLRSVVEDVPHFLPVHFFYTGEKRVRSFAVHYDTMGARWIALTSGPRNIKMYDILELNRPMLLRIENSKDTVTSLDWSPIWESIIIGIGDGMSTNSGRSVLAISPVNSIYSRTRIDGALCGVTQVHYNPLVNVTAYATENGDLTFLATRELYYEDILPKSMNDCKAISMMDMKCLNGEAITKHDLKKEVPPGWQNPEEGCKEKYGLVFGSVLKYKPAHKPQYLSEKRKPRVNLSHCMCINALRWNLNEKGKQFVAVGYENGFLRVMNFERKRYFK